MCPTFHCNLTVRFTFNCCSKYNGCKLVYSFFTVTSILDCKKYMAIKSKLPFMSMRSLPPQISWCICGWYFQIFDKSQCRGELSCAAQKTRRLNGCVAVVLYSYRLLEDRRSKEVKCPVASLRNGFRSFFRWQINNTEPKPCNYSPVILRRQLRNPHFFLLTLFWFQQKWQHFWKNWGLRNCLLKMKRL